MSNHANLIYALKDGMITSIKDVQSGLKCGCVCPACGAQLVARKGMKKMHHFAHYSGENCEYGYETSLHLAAKDILSKAKKMTIPAVYVHFPHSPKGDELVSSEMEITIDRVELEKRIGRIIPDVVIHSGDKQFLVEIFVTHPIEDEKLKTIEAENISTIEIDLSSVERTITIEELSEILLEKNEKKIWKYNSIAKKWHQSFVAMADKRELIYRGLAVHVDWCPIGARNYKGKPYANFIDDCHDCGYCISYATGDSILCSGRKRISTVQDFSVSEEVRIEKDDAKRSEEKLQRFIDGWCPRCGGKLVARKGKYGPFFGCDNYPYCRFTANIDKDTGELQMSI